MPRLISRKRWSTGEFRFVWTIPLLLAILLLGGFPIARGSGERVRFMPDFSVGRTLRYHIDTVTTTTTKTTSPVIDPQAGSKLKQTVNLVMSFNVLGVQPPTAAGPERVRFAATYDDAVSHTETDTFNPNPTSADAQYAQLKGRTTEFTLNLDDGAGSAGNTNATGGPSPASGVEASAFSWLKGVALPGQLARNGIEIGQKWMNERTLPGLPFADVVWRAESTYLRNETCDEPSAADHEAGHSPAAPQMCGVILTKFEISRRGGEHSDATPQDYRKHGLRTEGKLQGMGQSLDSVSLSTGFLVSSTQTTTQDADYEIISVGNDRNIHHIAHVEMQTEIAAVPQTPAGS